VHGLSRHSKQGSDLGPAEPRVPSSSHGYFLAPRQLPLRVRYGREFCHDPAIVFGLL